MIAIINLILTGLALYTYVNLFLTNINDQNYAIAYKIYLFLFVFIIQSIINFIDCLISNKKICINELIEISVNNALLTVIAYDVYNDLIYNGYYKSFTNHQRIMVLILLIISFMTVIKLLQLLIINN